MEKFSLICHYTSTVENFLLHWWSRKISPWFATTLVRQKIFDLTDSRGKFSTVSTTVEKFPTELHFVGKSHAMGSSGWMLENFPLTGAINEKLISPTSLFRTGFRCEKWYFFTEYFFISHCIYGSGRREIKQRGLTQHNSNKKNKTLSCTKKWSSQKQ